MSKFIFLILSFSISTYASPLHWTKKQIDQYRNREFVELQNNLLLQRKPALAQKIANQFKNLSGCQSLHEGWGKTKSFIKCVKFLNNEKEINLYSPKRMEVLSDMNTLCQELGQTKSFAEKIIAQDRLLSPKGEWKVCHSAVWRQIYLTVYANFRADPVGMLSLVRKAEEKLGPSQVWKGKISMVFRHH